MSGQTSPDGLEMMTVLRTAAIGPIGPSHSSELPRSGLVQWNLSVIKPSRKSGVQTGLSAAPLELEILRWPEPRTLSTRFP
jgi:hypothetical protein